MKDSTRAAVAGVCAAILNRKKVSSVYSFASGKHISVSVSVDSGTVVGYDHSVGCHIRGTPPSLYHYGDGHHIQVNVIGERIRGYDYYTGSHFDAQVSGSRVQIYDYQGGSHWTYSAT